MSKKLLMAFDFDHTIVNDNTDVVVKKLVAKDEVKKLCRSKGWTSFMQEVFHILHKNKVTPEQIHDIISQIPVTPGMDVLLRRLKQSGSEVVIISDSNSVFINDWLESAQLADTVHRIFTNPAHFDKDGHLFLQMYHVQDWCSLSSKNLCKGHILSSYIEERATEGVRFSRIAYAGDGKNDLCPCLRLSEKDLAFARENYPLSKCIQELQTEKNIQLKAEVHIWKSGEDILKVLEPLSKF